jgi:prepilin-type N-terminal cleavage/methylation domain-containing protein
MYANNKPKTYFGQAKKPRTSGFTLVEIMIVILIIVMLTQL